MSLVKFADIRESDEFDINPLSCLINIIEIVLNTEQRADLGDVWELLISEEHRVILTKITQHNDLTLYRSTTQFIPQSHCISFDIGYIIPNVPNHSTILLSMDDMDYDHIKEYFPNHYSQVINNTKQKIFSIDKPIPCTVIVSEASWSPNLHKLYPLKIRRRIYNTFLCWTRKTTILSKIPRDILYLIFKYVALHL